MTLIKLNGVTIDAEDTLRRIKRRRLEASLYDFFVAAWPHIDSAEFAHGGYALQAMCAHLEACTYGYIPNLLINVPPRFSKSTLVGTMFPAWVWAQNDNSSLAGAGAQFLHASYSMALALQDSVKCRSLIESDWYQHLWGDRYALQADQNTKTRFNNDKQGFRNTTSVGGSTTGLGGSYLIGDDLNNSAEANSEAIIQSTIEWWDTAWYNRLNNSRPGKGCRIVVAQRLSEQDISGHVLERQIGAWTHLCLPMRYDPSRSFHTVLVPAGAEGNDEDLVWEDPRSEAGELLWPERFGEEQVVLLEKTLGPTAASGQLQQLPQTAGGGIIKTDWWQLWADDHYPPMDFVIAALDTAYTMKQENDFSALTVWGVFSGNADTMTTRHVNRYGKEIVHDTPAQFRSSLDAIPKVMLMAAWQERLPLHELVLKTVRSCREMQVDKLLIENKAAGHSVAQELRRLYAGEGFGVELYDPRALDKLARLYSVEHIFAEGMVFAPDRSWADMVINQVATFPKGKHDDLVDTVSMAIRNLRDSGLLMRSSERMRELEDSRAYQGSAPPPLYPV
jgi:predicted phage terminase large subunit-like protein